MDALTRMYHTLNPRMHEKAAKVHRWFTMSYKQWQETGTPVGVDKEHDEEVVDRELAPEEEAEPREHVDLGQDAARFEVRLCPGKPFNFAST